MSLMRIVVLLGFLSACASASGPSSGVVPGSDAAVGRPDAQAPVIAPVPLMQAESCGNGLDDEGNGQADDGCPCTPGATQSCFIGPPSQAGVGICARGTQTCMASGEFGLWAACTGSGASQPEVCDTIDNDCNGAVDDGVCAPPPMPTPPPAPTPPTPPAPVPPPATCSAPTDLTPMFAGDSRTIRGTTCGATDVARLRCNRATGAPDAFYTWWSPDDYYSVYWEVSPGFEVGLAQADSPCSPGTFECEYVDESDYAHPHTLVVEKSDGTCGDFTLTVTREY